MRYLLGLFVICMLSLQAAKPSENKNQEPQTSSNFSERMSPNAQGSGVFADLLFWTAKEAGADCWSEIIHTNATGVSNELRAVHFGWDPGFRVGFNFQTKHDDWDTQLYYTWFYTKGTDAVSSTPGSVYSTFMGNFYLDNTNGKGISGIPYDDAKINWTIRFNMFDWKLGRKCLMSRAGAPGK